MAVFGPVFRHFVQYHIYGILTNRPPDIRGEKKSKKILHPLKLQFLQDYEGNNTTSHSNNREQENAFFLLVLSFLDGVDPPNIK